jgi:hypothetical protein
MKNRQDAIAYGTPYKNPFDEGWRKNLKRVFGDIPWTRQLWPIVITPPPPKYPFELRTRDIKDGAFMV